MRGQIGLSIRYLIFLIRLGANEEQLDFPIIYASAINGIAGEDHEAMADDMTPVSKRC